MWSTIILISMWSAQVIYSKYYSALYRKNVNHISWSNQEGATWLQKTWKCECQSNANPANAGFSSDTVVSSSGESCRLSFRLSKTGESTVTIVLRLCSVTMTGELSLLFLFLLLSIGVSSFFLFSTGGVAVRRSTTTGCGCGGGCWTGVGCLAGCGGGCATVDCCCMISTGCGCWTSVSGMYNSLSTASWAGNFTGCCWQHQTHNELKVKQKCNLFSLSTTALVTLK